MNKLLERQMQRYLPGTSAGADPVAYPGEDEIARFVQAVNNSYNGFEKDLALSARAFHISEQDYKVINEQLTEEVNIRKKRLTQLITNLNNGILVEDENRKIILANQLYCDMFGIPAPPDHLTGMDCSGSAGRSKFLFKDPNAFVARVDELLVQKQLVTGDELELADGRVLVRDYVPIYIEDDYKGHLWKYKDITEEKYYQKELQRLALVASANENGVTFCRPDGVVFWANEGFLKLTGYTMEDLGGRTAVELCKGPLSDRVLLREMVADFMNGRNFDVEVIHYRKDGTWFWGRAKGQAILDEAGKLEQYFAIIEDITERKNVEAALIEARESAVESSQAKEIFLANMSHEIRTPMNAILGMSRQLQKTELCGKQRTFLDTIHSAAENLLVIINDILDISKIEAGKLTLEKIGFRMQDVIMRTKQVMLHKAEEKGLKLSVSIGDEVSAVLLGDPYRLNQVLLNLVSNALKFTERGTVSIDCQSGERTGRRQMITLKVTDTGIGMDKSFVRDLFQKFLQEDKTVARKYGGTGLGMSISKQLVELMDGHIQVFSEKGKGTEIVLFIPFDIGLEDDLPAGQESPADAAILKDKRVLLVEDNEMNRFLANTVLSNYGAVVSEANNGMEAVKAVKHHHYDIVLMDVQMPVMDGREATRIIRKEIDKKIPIIALTANAIKGEMEICLAAGMNDYVSKPFEEDDLIKKICHWLGREITTAVKSKNEAAEIQLYSLAQLEETGRGDEKFLQEMLQLVVQQIPAGVDEIKTAYLAKRFDTIRKVAHRIKPVLGNLCIDVLKDEIREMETLATENRHSPRLEKLIGHLEEVASKVIADIRIRRKIS
jgi:PAS domain S-box-containing protein